jgi:membrane protein DedA with SNARE-associated domain
VGGVALAIAVLATLLEELLDFFDISLDAGLVVQTVFTQPQLFSVPLVMIEEAGLPLPISGDLLIMYSASRVGRSPFVWLALGLAFEAAALAGSTFLFFVARRYGAGLLRGEVGRVLGLTPARIQRVEGWFKRWGIWAVIVGRQIPGFRVATTVVAASFGLTFRLFVAGVAVGAAFWVTVFMALGLLVGPQAAQLLGAHQNSSLLILGAVFLVGLILIVGRVTWSRRRGAVS